MFMKQVLLGEIFLSCSVSAAPAPAKPTSNLPQLPFELPTNYPSPETVTGNGRTESIFNVPTHFGIWGYSYDGTIFNQSYYADGQPYNKDLWGFLSRPQDAHNNQTFGSYAFGIGPHGHLFAANDGRVATTSSGPDINWVLFESWGDWWRHQTLDHEAAEGLPTCKIEPFFDLLLCHLDGQRFKFGYCANGVAPGIGYSPGTVVWGTSVDPCAEIVLHVKQVPKMYGNQFPEKACPAYPYIEACKGKGQA